ncbi:MAG: tRNA (guanosine(37)-N1)-methyltransferase TrmD [Pseudomonadales bacterium]|jgi:tRNA (guanine37-N1)-methyltransferase|nr:tRNA (guanosine(37)-N1)-methyltransferase TrmD [Pseudomonadales bacterium]
MRIGVVTLFPEMLEAVTAYGITGRAVASGLLSVSAFDPRSHAPDRHRTVDDKPYGGGPGMVMKVEPVRAALRDARRALPDAPVLHLTPQGRRFDQSGARELAGRDALILLAGRYEGIDERVIDRDVDEEWSIGDFVLSGGELAAMVVIDAVCRLLPGALGDEGSAAADSFMDGLLDHPHYTRPEVIDGQGVPDVLLSGNHEAIRRWRLMQALGRTLTRRPDLLAGRELDAEMRRLLDAYLTETGE